MDRTEKQGAYYVLSIVAIAIIFPINVLLIYRILGWQAVVIWACGHLIKSAARDIKKDLEQT